MSTIERQPNLINEPLPSLPKLETTQQICDQGPESNTFLDTFNHIYRSLNEDNKMKFLAGDEVLLKPIGRPQTSIRIQMVNENRNTTKTYQPIRPAEPELPITRNRNNASVQRAPICRICKRIGNKANHWHSVCPNRNRITSDASSTSTSRSFSWFDPIDYNKYYYRSLYNSS